MNTKNSALDLYPNEELAPLQIVFIIKDKGSIKIVVDNALVQSNAEANAKIISFMKHSFKKTLADNKEINLSDNNGKIIKLQGQDVLRIELYNQSGNNLAVIRNECVQ